MWENDFSFGLSLATLLTETRHEVGNVDDDDDDDGDVTDRYADVRAVRPAELRPRSDSRVVLQQTTSPQEHHQEAQNSRMMLHWGAGVVID